MSARARTTTALAAAALLALTACGVTGPTAHRAATPDRVASATPTAESSSTPSASATAPSLRGGAAAEALIPVPGFRYAELPDALAAQMKPLESTGLAASWDGKGVTELKGGRTEVAIIAVEYTPELADTIDAMDEGAVLDTAASSLTGGLHGTVTTHDLRYSGQLVRLLRTPTLAFAVTYLGGGLLVQVVGPAPTSVLAFTQAYLAARATA
jgi:predicted small lipoprotein YifL